jgi:NAD(P)-dependent dehydrogenase (short-subunit alcohol dehydrogenase family)
MERQCSTPRLGRPSDVASAVAFLASEEAAFITGIVLPIEGGLMSHRATFVEELERELEGASSSGDTA